MADTRPPSSAAEATPPSATTADLPSLEANKEASDNTIPPTVADMSTIETDPSSTSTEAPLEDTVSIHHELDGAVNTTDAQNTPEANPSDEDELQTTPLEGLITGIQSRADMQRRIGDQALNAMIKCEDEKDQKRIEKAQLLLSKLQADEKKVTQRKEATRTNTVIQRQTTTQLKEFQSEILAQEQEIAHCKERIQDRHTKAAENRAEQHCGTQQLANESRRDFLIRTGKITPFNQDSFEGDEDEKQAPNVASLANADGPKSYRNLHLPSFGIVSEDSGAGSESVNESSPRPRKKRRVGQSSKIATATSNDSDDDFNPVVADDYESDDDIGFTAADGGITARKGKRKLQAEQSQKNIDLSKIDDGNEEHYQMRLKDWVKKRSRARKQFAAQATSTEEQETGKEVEEWHRPCPNPATPDHEFNDGQIRVPGEIYEALHDFQRVGVQWLGELMKNKTGGILADEMGLGKTIQVIAFLASLHTVGALDGPVIIVAPATLLRQWVEEFHKWWPALRVSILHSSGSGMSGGRSTKARNAAKRVARTIVTKGHILVTSYDGLETYKDILLPIKWVYAVLDEGHKIKNPKSVVTFYCKSLITKNRLILSGTPIQNNLEEMWSMFDFVYPGLLGTLFDFTENFDRPIREASHKNASRLQEITAEKMARMLKDTYCQFLLHRTKANVESDLPSTMDDVFCCTLTPQQLKAYKMATSSDEFTAILDGRRNVLSGMNVLRDICNHPDLADPLLEKKPGYRFGCAAKSGKMKVVKDLLDQWKANGDKVLLFTQGRKMLNILEEFMERLGHNYLRMDGETPVTKRSAMVENFNEDPDKFVFLLTTKVGGLGINLTSANRVIIYDPNWNPAIDTQAKDRVCRLGQKRDVHIIYLMVGGSIEEKVIHRQMYKEYLTEKVMKDPTKPIKLPRKDMADMFSFKDLKVEDETETSKLFEGSEIEKFSRFGSLAAGSSRGQTPATNYLLLNGVVSVESMRPEVRPETAEELDARLTRAIYSKMGVHSIYSRTQLIRGQRVEADTGMLEREANRVVEELAKDMRKKKADADRRSAGEVTETGRPGETGRSGGVSSAPGGARSGPTIRRGNIQAQEDTRQQPSKYDSSYFEPRLIKFIKAQEGRARNGQGVPAKMIFDHFKFSTRGDADWKIFVGVFHRVCKVTKPNAANENRQYWGLKAEFDNGERR